MWKKFLENVNQKKQHKFHRSADVTSFRLRIVVQVRHLDCNQHLSGSFGDILSVSPKKYAYILYN